MSSRRRAPSQALSFSLESDEVFGNKRALVDQQAAAGPQPKGDSFKQRLRHAPKIQIH